MNETSTGANCDSVWVKALQANSAEAFRSLFDQYHKKIFFVCKKLGLSSEDAECVVQDVFLLVWEKRFTLRADLSFNAFLLTLTKRNAIKKMRHAVVSKKYLQQFIPQTPGNNCTEELILLHDLESFALDCIEAMPTAQKEIFLLSKREGLDNDEIAQQLHLSKRTVENQLYRATKSIKAHLQKEDYLPPMALGFLLAITFC